MAIKLILGDALTELRKLPSESVHCCVTSPPYWNLRDYGTASWAGGDPACDHRQAARKPADWSTSGLQRNKKTPELSAGTMALVNHQQEPHYLHLCGRCGAVRSDRQIGLEATPELFVATLVEVFREVRRVLRKDGTLWLNLGDVYGGGASGGSVFDGGRTDGRVFYEGDKPRGRIKTPRLGGLKPKDLLGIPWRVAFALQADGWTLRSEIIWHKPSAMPESVTDRPSKAHEQIFLLSRSPRYYYDAEAIAEPTDDNGRRNKRDVWTVASAPFPGSHFATFPPALIEPCILAGCPTDCCAKCGAPVVREVEKTFVPTQNPDFPKGGRKGLDESNGWGDTPRGNTTAITTGWSPSCACDAGLARGTVLDPFGGAGTTGLVADRLQRSAILIELNGDYLKLANGRILDDGPLFADVTQAEADIP